MTIESAVLIYISKDAWDAEYVGLVEQARRCVQRHAKAVPGDRQEALRYDGLCLQLERLAQQQLERGAFSIALSDEDVRMLDASNTVGRHPWRVALEAVPLELKGKLESLRQRLLDGGGLVELRNPFEVGVTPLLESAGVAPIAPAEPWRPPHGERGIQAVAARWEGQLEAAMAGSREPIVPSGVSNRVLTEGLRRFVVKESGHASGEARVVYRDGSEARPFPLGSIDLDDTLPAGWPVLAVALLSMRHPEMDADVDGAWLRNRDVSQVRPGAETDALVFEASLQQFRDLEAHAPLILRLYQTGLEPAIMGFYRALTQHITEGHGGITVSPYYYRRIGVFEEGTPWVRRR